MEQQTAIESLKYFTALIFMTILTNILIFLLYKILNPAVISYPWTNSDKINENQSKHDNTKKTIIFAGSFNPPHNGHLCMIEHLSKIYEEVVIVIGINPLKKYKVNPTDRAKIMQQMIQNKANTAANNNIKVQVVSDYIWRHAYKVNAKYLYRGIRTWRKDGMDEQFLLFLNIIGPILLGPLKRPIPTVYLEGNPEYNHISSTLIRNLCSSKEKKEDNTNTNHNSSCPYKILQGLVPDEVADLVWNLYSK